SSPIVVTLFMVFSSFLMVANNSIMAHCDAVNKGEETISSTYTHTEINYRACTRLSAGHKPGGPARFRYNPSRHDVLSLIQPLLSNAPAAHDLPAAGVFGPICHRTGQRHP
ncbi:MAG: hypothetical protein OEM43_04665, partial [Gammaproteobacteria bacterium]|nr:hypothetical protein [Gammaproteobacteria bacterium]